MPKIVARTSSLPLTKRFYASAALVFVTTGALASLFSCSLAATRPVQEMSDASAAIKAAKGIQADTIAPELYREANEWWRRARHEYRFKNFDLASQYAKKARLLAEQAEFEAMQSSGQRAEAPAPEPTPTSTSAPYAYPTPTAIPAESVPKGTPGGGIPTPSGGGS